MTEGTDASPPSSSAPEPPPELPPEPVPESPVARRAFVDDDAPEEPPIEDPYLLRPTPVVRRGVSRLAVSSLVAAPFGPVGAILAIVFGWHARREIEHEAALEAAAQGGEAAAPRRPGHGLATAGMALGVLLTMAWGGALSFVAWTYRYRADPAGDEPSAPAVTSARAVPGHPAPAPVAPRPQRVAEPDPPVAPKYTKTHRQGTITVVDVGIASASLADELAKQRAEASSAGETMMVMATSGGCDPCRGVDRSLADPLMQTALARVRLVRVDIQVFHEDLDALRMPHDGVPGFFLLAPDLTPRDGLNGGEWDDDIAANIAPVLGAFVRGKYTQRRETWQAVPASGMSL